MKRIPAGILFATLVLGSPVVPRLPAEESAAQLSAQDLGPDPTLQDESATQVKDKDLGPESSLQDESAAQLSKETLAPDQDSSDESAAQLSEKTLGPDQTMQDQSAAGLAEQQGVEKKPKVTAAPASEFGTGEGVDGVVYATVAQADGAILIGGRFESINGQPRKNLARFLADGTLDAKFLANPADGVDGTVYALALDPNGNVLAGGYFTVQGQPQQNLVRYSAAGALDQSFAGGQSPNGTVYAIALQPKGQIVAGGEFTQIGDAPRRNLARFKADGTLDGALNSAAATTGAVRSLATLPTGGVLVGGELNISGRTTRNLLIAP